MTAAGLSILCQISIHAPREGCDQAVVHTPHAYVKFQSTHPVRGATSTNKSVICRTEISIHAPREGCDSFRNVPPADDFKFQSTHPVRGAT